jgi:hypothetical protein
MKMPIPPERKFQSTTAVGRFDVLRSLVREAATKSSARLGTGDLGLRLQRLVSHALAGRLVVSDAELTAAVARVPGVAAATVTSAAGALHVDVALDDGRALGVVLIPHAVKFAPSGAKELAFRVDPPDIADDGRARDVFAALAGTIARALWKPVLRADAGTAPSAFATRDENTLILDLRTVPTVRDALRTRMGAIVIDTVSLRSLEAHPGGLTLRLTLPGAWG